MRNGVIMERITEIRNRLDKITQSTWYVRECRDGAYAGKNCCVYAKGIGEVVGIRQLGYPQVKEIEANAEFIANAPDDIKYLLEEIDRLNGLIGCGCGICLAHNNMKCPKME